MLSSELRKDCVSTLEAVQQMFVFRFQSLKCANIVRTKDCIVPKTHLINQNNESSLNETRMRQRLPASVRLTEAAAIRDNVTHVVISKAIVLNVAGNLAEHPCSIPRNEYSVGSDIRWHSPEHQHQKN